MTINRCSRGSSNYPPQRMVEVEDFFDLLRARESGRRLTNAAAKASEPSFVAVRDNEDDAV